MITYELIINPFAELDLQISQDWYNMQKEGLGKEFTLEVDKVISRVTQNPKHFLSALPVFDTNQLYN